MCGRYKLSTPGDELWETFDIQYPFGQARSGQSRLRSLSRRHGQTGADESYGVAEGLSGGMTVG